MCFHSKMTKKISQHTWVCPLPLLSLLLVPIHTSNIEKYYCCSGERRASSVFNYFSRPQIFFSFLLFLAFNIFTCYPCCCRVIHAGKLDTFRMLVSRPCCTDMAGIRTGVGAGAGAAAACTGDWVAPSGFTP